MIPPRPLPDDGAVFRGRPEGLPARVVAAALPAVLVTMCIAGCTSVGDHVDKAINADGNDDPAREKLVQVLAKGKPDTDRARAAWTLGSIASVKYIQPLREALADESPLVRAMAAEALGRIAEPPPVPDLAICLEDHDPHVRRAAVTALQRINTRESRAAVADYFRRNPVGTSPVPGSRPAKGKG